MKQRTGFGSFRPIASWHLNLDDYVLNIGEPVADPVPKAVTVVDNNKGETADGVAKAAEGKKISDRSSEDDRFKDFGHLDDFEDGSDG